MTKFVIIILCFCSAKENAQANMISQLWYKDSVIKVVFFMPMNNVTKVKYADDESYRRGPVYIRTNYASFMSQDSAVFSISEGVVLNVAQIDDMNLIIIESGKLFFTYSNLGLVYLKKGDMVKINQIIGYATKDLDGNGPIIDLYLSTENAEIILHKKNFMPRQVKNTHLTYQLGQEIE